MKSWKEKCEGSAPKYRGRLEHKNPGLMLGFFVIKAWIPERISVPILVLLFTEPIGLPFLFIFGSLTSKGIVQII